MYYLYRHIRLDKKQPFYIGIGTKKASQFESDIYSRALDKRGRNLFWKRIVAKTEYQVEIMYETDDFDDVLKKEIFFIEFYGKYVNGGILCNLTDGGESNYGYKHSAEYCEKCRKRAIVSNPNKGKCLSEAHRAKIGAAHKGKNISQEALIKLKNRKYPIICIENQCIYNNAGIAAKLLFGSDSRYLRDKVAESARKGNSFKNHSFKWLAK